MLLEDGCLERVVNIPSAVFFKPRAAVPHKTGAKAMNTHVKQLELVPAVAVTAAAAPLPVALSERPIAEAGDDPDDFDWRNEESVVVKSQPGIAVYENPHGETVIRTQNISDPDFGDHFAYVTPKALPAVIAALKRHVP
jgi:hypothetical protein